MQPQCHNPEDDMDLDHHGYLKSHIFASIHPDWLLCKYFSFRSIFTKLSLELCLISVASSKKIMKYVM